MTHIPDTVRRYWAQSPKPAAVYMLVSLGSEQPVGYVKGWSVNRRHTERMVEKQWEPDKWSVVKVAPPR